MKCVEVGLVEILGPSGKDAIVYHLASKGVTIADSFDQPAKFAEAIRMIFSHGSEIIEDRFAECIGSAFQVDVKDRALPEIVMRVRGLRK